MSPSIKCSILSRIKPISCVFMCTLSLFYILAIAVLYFKKRYTVEAILIKLNIYENNY